MSPQDLLYFFIPFLSLIATILTTFVVALVLNSLFKRRLKQTPAILATRVRRLAWTSTWLVGGLVALQEIGFRLDILLLLVGLLGVALVIGYKDVLQNLAARYFHEVYVPFKVGDTIQVRGYSGKVVEINPITTVLLTDGESLVSIPNATFLRENIVNTTPHAWQEANVPVEIGNNIDLAEFEKQTLLACNKLRTHLDQRFPPVISIKERGDKSIQLQLTLMVRDPEKKDAIISEVNSRMSEITERLGQPRKA